MTDLILVTIAVPEAMLIDANQLARCVGYGPDDDQTFRTPCWQDAEGNVYSVASGPVWPAFLAVPGQTLVEPEWGADMEAAERAQATLRVSDMRSPEDPEAAPPIVAQADVDHVSAVIGPEGLTALGLLGLVPVAPEAE